MVCNQSLEIQKDNGMAAMLDGKIRILSPNMAATPFSFGSLEIGCKPPIGLRIKIYFSESKLRQRHEDHVLLTSKE